MWEPEGMTKYLRGSPSKSPPRSTPLGMSARRAACALAYLFLLAYLSVIEPFPDATKTAAMRGKTFRQRIGELLAITHPDCKAGLKDEAKRIYGWSF